MERTDFEARWAQSEPQVRTFLAAGCRDAAVVQDLVQEVALDAWRKRSDFNPGLAFTAWVVGMARFTLLRHRRDLARRFVVLAPDLLESLEQTVVAESELLDRRRGALGHCRGKLGASATKMLDLRLNGGLPLAEVARRLERTHGAVRTAFARTREWLRTCIERRLAGEPVDDAPEEAV